MCMELRNVPAKLYYYGTEGTKDAPLARSITSDKLIRFFGLVFFRNDILRRQCVTYIFYVKLVSEG